MGQSRMGSTKILTILPEGTPVHEGDVVCTLDSATFRDTLRTQEITVSQAKSWVDQVQMTLDVAEIDLKQYTEGVLPQDRMLTQQYIDGCKTDLERNKLILDWTKNALEKGLQTDAQLKSARANYERSELALREAQGMLRRLNDYTAPRIIANLEAKIAAIQADHLAQQAAYKIELNRKERLEKNIANCTLRAPRSGIVVYVNESNGWGDTEAMIQEGTTVREGQAIFSVPDSTEMRVKAKINESKVSQIRPDMKAVIQVDALAGQFLPGVVTDVTAIPASNDNPFSDVKLYSALVRIGEGAPSGLRPGMSAEVRFLLDRKRDVLRLPVNSIRRVGEHAFAAIPERGEGFRWQPIELGLTTAAFAEIKSGLAQGEAVLADPSKLQPAPKPPSAIARDVVVQTAQASAGRTARPN
jgi:multidrug resistance efflux pump